MDTNKFQLLRLFYERNKRMPSYSEIMAITGYKSRGAVDYFLDKLISLSLVSKDKKGRLIPGKIFEGIPVVGTVMAGFPSPAEEETVDTMNLDEFLIHNKDATYIFKVKGDSMIDAGIMEGDMALVERGRDPKDGDIVLAQIDQDWTLKYFRKRGAKVWLEPANKKYEPIYPKEELKIPAVVISIIRKYKS